MAAAISKWPAHNRLNPSLIPVSMRSILVLFPAQRKALIAYIMIGKTVLEPPIRIVKVLVPEPWVRECA